MLTFDDDDDEFPPIPLSTPGPPPHVMASLCTHEDSTSRLRQLEADVEMLKRVVAQQACPATLPLRGECEEEDVMSPDRSAAESTPVRAEQTRKIGNNKKKLSADPHGDATPGGQRSRTPNAAACTAEEDEETLRRNEVAETALRRLVPHLSPSFHCSYNDCILITAAIRNGGCVTGRHGKGAGSMGSELSLQDRLTVSEAEKKQLQQRIAKLGAECEGLRRDLAGQKDKWDAVRRDARLASTQMEQKSYEMRRELMLEEMRSEKLRVQNRKLTVEMEQLKQRMRGHF